MADTAAFFAKKKKGGKKKAFKAFNANKIDVSAVTSSTHVDAPEVSEVGSTLASTSISTDPVTTGTGGGASQGEQWDDEALAARLSKPVVTGGGGASELLDMKALEKQRNEEDDIAERMRVEETKAQLAAAKEGMEREAARLKEEKESKGKAKQDAAIGKPRFGAAAASVGGSGAGAGIAEGAGGKWVPPHLRGGSAARMGLGAGTSLGGSRFSGVTTSGYQGKVDTQDENLFPDLASAEAIISQQQEQQKAAKVVPKKKLGASPWGGARPAAAAPAPAPASAPAPAATEQVPEKNGAEAEEEKPEVKVETAEASAPAPAASSAPAVSTTAAAGAGLKKKKKKKKDLSTFKMSS